MNLHEDKKAFKDAINVSANLLGLQEQIIEKDYWVTLALYEIYHSEIGQYCVFKGGTSLSKCYRMIERFSEDIDIVVIRDKNDTENKLKTRLKKVTNIVSKAIKEVKDERTNKKGRIRKTVHEYPTFFQDTASTTKVIKDKIILEVNSFGHFEPNEKKKIHTLIYDAANKIKNIEPLKDYNLLPFEVTALNPKRTFCEKLISLMRFSFSDDFVNELQNNVRHIYDIALMLKDKNIKTFFNSNNFDQILLKVAEDDIERLQNRINWLTNHPKEAVIFKEYEDIWQKIRNYYYEIFKPLVYGEFPIDEQILSVLAQLKQRLEDVDWTNIRKLIS